MNQIELICRVLLIILLLGFMFKVICELTWIKYLEKNILKTEIEGNHIGKTDILYKRIFTSMKCGQYICLIKNKYYLVEISTFLFDVKTKINDISESEVVKLSDAGFERVN